jgi:hypothetical protein
MPFFVKGGYLLLLGIGLSLFILGQRWCYGTRWHTPDRNGPVDVDSNDYKAAIIQMTIAGSRAALTGGLLAIFSLAQLGFLD